MNKIIFLALFSLFAFADAIKADTIKIEHARLQPLGKVIQTNAKITQLSNQQQQVVSILGGHIENYFVKPGEEVKKGERVVLIQSLELSRMTAEYRALAQQIKAASHDLDTAKTLFKKGVGSKQEQNAKVIALQEINSRKNTLKSQLEVLGIDPGKLTNATDKLILYAHADGVVGELLAPLHSTVDAQTPLVTLVNQSGYYALAYLSPKDAAKLNSKVKGWIVLADQKYPCSFVQLLPEIDTETQRAQALFWIEKNPKKLLLNAFVEIEIELPPYSKAVMIKKSALSLFSGEWVVFVPQEEEHDEEHHKDHDAEGEEEHHDDNKEHEHTKESHHEEHEEHDKGEIDEHEGEDHESVPYLPQVVRIIAYSGNEVAVEGIHENEAYVSEGVYFVKSLILKSSLGGHGH